MTDRELMQQALDALEYSLDWSGGEPEKKAIEALRARLAQPEPEPVAWMYEHGTDHGDAVNQIFWHKNLRLEKPTGLVRNVVPLYTAPPQREWQGLTDEEVEALDCTTVNACDWNEYEVYKPSVQEFARAIEAKLKEKNNG